MDQDHQDHNERTSIERRDGMIGEIFDRRFRIEARIAAGGFGAIYRATHIKSGHELALKVLHANLTHDPGVVARFRREGAALTRLRDPHTITAYELGEAPDGTLYIVLELLRGQSLYERFRTHGPLPWPRVVSIARAVCSSLAEAHALGIIHRDLKPTNIHLEPRGSEEEFVKVLDFGIAKIVRDSDLDSSELTHAGQMIGTLDYMSPEQMVGGMCDATSDIYTLGVVMYEMIAGRKPFDDANSAAAALAAVLTTTPARLAVQAMVPADVDRVVMRCLERQHTERFQSAGDLAAALDEILASTEEAVTTVDLTSPRGGITTIKGMRLPARLPSLTPGPPSAGHPATGHPVPGQATAGPAAADPAAAVPAAVATETDEAPTVPSPTIPPGPTSASSGIPPVVHDAPSVAVAASAVAGGAERAAPAAPASSPARRPASPPRLTPSVPKPAPMTPEHTLVGPLPPPRPPARRKRPRQRQPPTGTPPAGSRITNLREAYPTIHRAPPSPLRPQPGAFDDRPPSSVGVGPVYDMTRVVRRDMFMRRLLLGVAIAFLLLAGLLIATW